MRLGGGAVMAWRMNRGTCAVLLALLTLAAAWIAAPAARAATGLGFSWFACVQNPGAADCSATGGTAPGMGEVHQVAVSPDGANVYVASKSPGAVAIFSRGAGGALTPRGCIENTGRTDCGPGNTAPGLAGARGVAVSPDGATVYVVSDVSSAVVAFNRGPGGALTPLGCIENTGGTDCGPSNTTPGLAGARGVTVSPDGRSVYVASFGRASFAGGAVVAFSRGVGGGLTPIGCVENAGAGSGCGASQAGLGGARGVVVSPDGGNVYVAAHNSNAVTVFSRAADGTLTSRGCIQNTGGTACGAVAAGLAGAYFLAISPDGANVYLAAFDGNDVAEFSRGPGGALTWRGCIQNTGGHTCTASGGTAPGLGTAFGVAVTPDGSTVYAASLGSSAVAEFSRGAGGLLTSRGCIQNSGANACAASGGNAPGLMGANSVAVSPDGANVYAGVQYSNAVAEFARAVPMAPPVPDTVAIRSVRINRNGTADMFLVVTGRGGVLRASDAAVARARGSAVFLAATKKKKKKKPVASIRSISVRVHAGTVVLHIVPSLAGRKVLKKRKLAVNVLVTYTPTGGTTSKQTRKLTLAIKKKRVTKRARSHG